MSVFFAVWSIVAVWIVVIAALIVGMSVLLYSEEGDR